ncbi:hypothetical protein IGI57_000761 [Enterococcus sp. DIV0213j]|jgi:hypothetical protein
MISKSTLFIKKYPISAALRFVILAISISLFVNMLTGGQLYKSGLFFILILIILDSIKTQNKT